MSSLTTRRASSAANSATFASASSQCCQQQQRQRSQSAAPIATTHRQLTSRFYSRGAVSFLNGLRKAHLLRGKTSEANNSHITQPLMEGTQTTSITMQPIQLNPNDYCLMKITTDVVEDIDEVQKTVDISTTTTTTDTNPSTFYNKPSTTATEPTTNEILTLEQTTTALVTSTTSSSLNSITITAAAEQLNSTITNLTNPLVTLPITMETSRGICASKNTNTNNQIATFPPETVTKKATTNKASFTASDCSVDLTTSNSTRNANPLSLSPHDLEQIDEVL